MLGSCSVLDVRWELSGPCHEDYLHGHIPAAVFVDLDVDLAGAPGPDGRHPLPDADSFSAAMRQAGVSGSRPVVVYDAAAGMSAARAWWLLRYFGHPEVLVLDGGLRAWVSAGYPVERGPCAAAQGDFVARAGGLPVLDAAGAGELARRGVLLDARALERYAGAQEPIDPVAGHIPGALSHPTTRNVDDSGRFLPRERLLAQFAQAGLDAGVPAGAYCGSGVTAAHEVLALEAAGLRGALYVGSWSEWITDPRRPVAVGPEPG